MKRKDKHDQPTKSKNFGACLPEHLWRMAVNRAHAEDVSLSKLIRRALIAYGVPEEKAK